MWPFRRKTLAQVLGASTRVRVHGVVFRLRKIDTLDFVSGARVLHQHFDTYKTKSEQQQLAMAAENGKRIREHYVDVFMASVVEPKLSRTPNTDGAIFVENLLTDWDLASDLYRAVLEVTYGKKKLKSLLSRATASSSSTS